MESNTSTYLELSLNQLEALVSIVNQNQPALLYDHGFTHDDVASLRASLRQAARPMREIANGTAYPVCEEWARRSVDNDVLTDFFDWISEQKITFGKYPEDSDNFAPTYEAKTTMIYRYFAVDPFELDRERRAMLQAYRDAQAAK